MLRLNLGCGAKHLPGYVNVDFADNHSKLKPDVACDLHKLPFEDDYADEILSVHVIEHFWRWEVRDVLKEWVRVLKPGGLMVLECPNLLTACQEFVKNSDVLGDTDGAKTLWVFYGDPQWKDTHMVHRWGYTPNTLGTIMQECGLEKLARAPAQFKQREPRDMRVIGYKRGFPNCRCRERASLGSGEEDR